MQSFISGIDKRILLWDIAEAAPLADLVGHTACINSLAFSREGHVLASGELAFSSELS